MKDNVEAPNSILGSSTPSHMRLEFGHVMMLKGQRPAPAPKVPRADIVLMVALSLVAYVAAAQATISPVLVKPVALIGGMTAYVLFKFGLIGLKAGFRKWCVPLAGRLRSKARPN